MADVMDVGNRQLDEFEQQYDWRERHTLRAAAQGGVFPDVRFRRFRDQIEISWTAGPLLGADDVQFMSPPRAQRFTLAHELCHMLHDRSYGARLAIASGPWAPWGIEKRANALLAGAGVPMRR